MKYPQKSSRPRSRVKSRSNIFFYAVCASIILFVVIFYFYTKKESVNAHSNNKQIIIEKTDNALEGRDTALGESPDTFLQPQTINGATGTSAVLPVIEETDLPLSIDLPTTRSTTDQYLEQNNYIPERNDFLPEKSNYTDDESSIDNAQRLIQHLNNFYEHLDQQPYMKEFNLHRSSKDHFSTLLQNLVNSPPVVADETNDLFTLLKNTAHFFRILGKENIIVLKGILDREKASFENILKTFYSLTDYPEALKNEYGLSMSEEALYDYAGFFLNTMGGRLYLFRRDSASRMTVSFYAIQIINKAIIEGNNRHGIDLLPAIIFLIDEMENTGKRPLLKEEYLDVLYDLKEKYN